MACWLSESIYVHCLRETVGIASRKVYSSRSASIYFLLPRTNAPDVFCIIPSLARLHRKPPIEGSPHPSILETHGKLYFRRALRLSRNVLPQWLYSTPSYTAVSSPFLRDLFILLRQRNRVTRKDRNIHDGVSKVAGILFHKFWEKSAPFFNDLYVTNS